MKRHLASAIAVLMLALPALAGFGPEHVISGAPRSSSFQWAVGFDGTNYVVLYTDSERLRLQRVAEDGSVVEQAFELNDGQNSSSVTVACARDGYALALWLTRKDWLPPVLHGAIVPPRGEPSPSFIVAPDSPVWNSVAAVAVGGSFLVAWATNDGTLVARVDRSSSASSPRKVGDRNGYAQQLATVGSDVVLVWDEIEWSPYCAIPEGCPWPVPYIVRLTADGVPIGGREVWPQESRGPLDPTAGDLLIVQPYTVLRRVDGIWQRWTIPNATSLAKTPEGLYATVRRRYDDPVQTYLAPVGFERYLGAAYRFPVQTGNWYAAIVAGRTSMLALYSTSSDALSYRSADLTTPFSPLPVGPASASATLALSPKPYPNPWFQVNVQWTPAPAAVDHYLVDAEPLGNPSARAYSVSVDSKTTTAVFDQLQADVAYSFRVYGTTMNGLSAPAQADLRSPADTTVREPVDVTVSTDGTAAAFRWGDVSSNESGFRIAACQAKCITLMEVPANTTTATIRVLPGTYWYTVAAFNATDTSEGSPGYWLSAPERIRAVRR